MGLRCTNASTLTDEAQSLVALAGDVAAQAWISPSCWPTRALTPFAVFQLVVLWLLPALPSPPPSSSSSDAVASSPSCCGAGCLCVRTGGRLTPVLHGTGNLTGRENSGSRMSRVTHFVLRLTGLMHVSEYRWLHFISW